MSQAWKSKGDLRQELRQERERTRQLTLALHDTIRVATNRTGPIDNDDTHTLAVAELIGRTYGRS